MERIDLSEQKFRKEYVNEMSPGLKKEATRDVYKTIESYFIPVNLDCQKCHSHILG